MHHLKRYGTCAQPWWAPPQDSHSATDPSWSNQRPGSRHSHNQSCGEEQNLKQNLIYMTIRSMSLSAEAGMFMLWRVPYSSSLHRSSHTPIVLHHHTDALPGIAGRQGLEEIVEIHNYFVQREEELHHHPLLIDVHHTLLRSSTILQERQR